MSIKNRILFIYILLFLYFIHIYKCSFEEILNESNSDSLKEENNKKDDDYINLLNELREKTSNIRV